MRKVNIGHIVIQLPLTVEYDPDYEVRRVAGLDAWDGHPGPPPQIQWNKDVFDVTNVDVTFVMIRSGTIFVWH